MGLLIDILNSSVLKLPGADVTVLDTIIFSLIAGATYLLSRFAVAPAVEKILEKIEIEEEDRKTLSRIVFAFLIFGGLFVGIYAIGVRIMVLMNTEIFKFASVSITPLKILSFVLPALSAYLASKYIIKDLLDRLLRKAEFEESHRAILEKTTHFLIVIGGLYLGLRFLSLKLLVAFLSMELVGFLGATITPLKIIMSSIIVAITYLLSKHLIVTILDKIFAFVGAEKENRKNLMKIIHYLIVIGGIFAGIDSLGINISAPLTIQLVSFSGAPITPLKLIIFFITVIISYLISKFVIGVSIGKILKDAGAKEETIASVKNIVHYFIVFLGIYIGLNFLGIQLTSLLAVAGIAGIVLGFGLQPIIANLISGFILIGERSVQVGDWVEFDGMYGMVVDTGIRASTVRTIDNQHMLIPNKSFVESPFTNYSHSDKKIRVSVEVGVAYGSDIEKVKRILLEIAEENDTVMATPAPEVFFREFGESSLDFTLEVWISNPKYRQRVKSELNFEIERRFRKEDITIPFPQRDVWMKKKQGMTEEEIEDQEDI